jgi:hypothetical protein
VILDDVPDDAHLVKVAAPASRKLGWLSRSVAVAQGRDGPSGNRRRQDQPGGPADARTDCPGRTPSTVMLRLDCVRAWNQGWRPRHAPALRAKILLEADLDV